MTTKTKTETAVPENSKVNLNAKWRGAWYRDDLVTPVGRVHFNNITVPNTRLVTPKNPDPIYGYTLIVDNDPENEQYKGIKAAAKLLFMELSEYLHKVDTEAKKTKKSLEDYRQQMLAGIKYPTFRDGEQMEKYDGFEGKLYLSIRIKDHNNVRVGKGRSPEEVEAGMQVRSQVSMYLNESGFSYGHRLIYILKDDGVRYGGGGNSVDLLSSMDDAVDAVKIKENSDKAEQSYEDAVDNTAIASKGKKDSDEPAGLDVL